jgi:hypothetical protein
VPTLAQPADQIQTKIIKNFLKFFMLFYLEFIFRLIVANLINPEPVKGAGKDAAANPLS